MGSAIDRRGLIAGLAGSGLLAGCGPRAGPGGDPQTPGSIAEVAFLAGYPKVLLQVLLGAARLPRPVSVRGGAELYRLSYWSRTNGTPALVSGLVAVPAHGAAQGTALWMHGTNTNRAGSISAPSLNEGITAAAVFAGGGYLMLAPDLLGLGVSRAVQAYYYNPSTIAVTLDFLTAARRFVAGLGRAWTPDLYIAGFSQGGHSSAVMHRELERRADPTLRVRASAPISGAYNLADISIPFAMRGRSVEDSTYLAAWALSYATYYRRPLAEVLQPRYAASVTRLLDGDHTADIKTALPATPRSLFTPEFLAAFDAGQPHWLMDGARANEAYAWAPRAPLRAHYGGRDVDVPAEDTLAFVAEAGRRGGLAEAVNVGPYDHNATVFHAAPAIRAWFDQLSAQKT
ncbi:hypothetical protein [Phenylobacterium sp.]|jgi:hypothetical protein|uniref:hypothetical protein n=1 Tax=Phenylobacterium sp. TaxID=1871053 RepID=UPI002F42F4B8